MRPDLEKAPLAYLSDYWLQLAERARAGLTRVGREQLPAVVVAPGLAVTSPALGERLALEAGLGGGSSGDEAPFAWLGEDPVLGLAFVELKGESQAFELARLDDARPGSLVATVSLRPDGGLRITPSHLTAVIREKRHGLELSVRPPEAGVGAVVDLDGRLLGVAVSDAGADLRVPSAQSLGAAVERVRAADPCRALEVAAPEDAVRELLGASGLVVERVRGGAWAEEPPLRPGDVLLEFAGRPMTSVGEFAAAYDAPPRDQRVRFVLRRGRARVSGRARLPGRDCRPVAPAPLRLERAGLVLAWEPSGPGWRVADVAADGPAAQAGLERGDVLLSADAGRGDRLG
jgi:S1-C subfamily serine protease